MDYINGYLTGLSVMCCSSNVGVVIVWCDPQLLPLHWYLSLGTAVLVYWAQMRVVEIVMRWWSIQETSSSCAVKPLGLFESLILGKGQGQEGMAKSLTGTWSQSAVLEAPLHWSKVAGFLPFQRPVISEMSNLTSDLMRNGAIELSMESLNYVE